MLDPVADAAANNAAWCDAVCRAHGLPTAWSASAWTVGRRSPEGYPDAVTLSTSARPAGVLNGIHTGSGCSIKDSFAGLDLAPQGFRVLFEAPWIHRPAGDPNLTPILDWHEVRTPADLARWAEGHNLDVFVSRLLTDPSLSFYRSGAQGAGFALNTSGLVVGASNVVTGSADPRIVWSDVVTLAAQVHPNRDLVGYELEVDLDPVLAAGFTPLGRLRVWLR